MYILTSQCYKKLGFLKEIPMYIYSQIKKYGFKLNHWVRDKSRGGGLLTIYKPFINLINVPKLSTESEHATFESINTSCVLEKKRINVINLYRPPY